MRLSLRLSEAETMALGCYSGASPPLTIPTQAHRPLDCDWWRTPYKIERFNSGRHRGALRLYLELARCSLVPLPAYSFPSTFDFLDSNIRYPDKGFIKMCLNSDPPILSCRSMNGHLVFDLTEVGRAFLPA